MPGAVQEAVIVFADFLLKYFVALAAVGALAMALIELAKKVFDWRTRFHVTAVTMWMIDGNRDEKAAVMPYGELLHLCTGLSVGAVTDTAAELVWSKGHVPGIFWIGPKPQYAPFALELERMMGHFQDAADVALNFPDKYGNLYRFMTGGSDPGDQKYWEAQAPQPAGGTTVDRDEVKKRADTYARLNQMAKRKLDAFQLLAAHNWTNKVQFWANLLGVLILFGALIRATPATTAINWPQYVMLSLFGGVLSPIAKDIVVALKKVRQGV